jgi:hypothetical protein
LDPMDFQNQAKQDIDNTDAWWLDMKIIIWSNFLEPFWRKFFRVSGKFVSTDFFISIWKERIRFDYNVRFIQFVNWKEIQVFFPKLNWKTQWWRNLSFRNIWRACNAMKFLWEKNLFFVAMKYRPTRFVTARLFSTFYNLIIYVLYYLLYWLFMYYTIIRLYR